MITFEKFREAVGNKHAVIMECTHDGSPHRGRVYAKGKKLNVSTAVAYALYRQERWKPTDEDISDEERASLNKHFAQVHAEESGAKKVIKKSTKKSK